MTVTMVDDLYEANARTWNEQLVRQTFIAIDADEILKIQPSQNHGRGCGGLGDRKEWNVLRTLSL